MEAVNCMSKQDISFKFTAKEKEEVTSLFLLEDLIKEYNHKILLDSTSVQKKKVPLTLRPLNERAANPTIPSPFKESSVYPVIGPMTQEEINSMAGIPVAAGVGIVFVVGFLASVALDYFDQKTGLTERLTDAADKMLKDLEKHMNDRSKNQQRFKGWDLQKGLVFGGPFARHQRTLRNYLVSTA
jgi:hypothetical protein